MAADPLPSVAASPAPLSVATQAMVHATALAMANATHAQGCSQQINAAATAALIRLIMEASPVMPADMPPPPKPNVA